MASTPTRRGRLNKQATFDNPDAWGPVLNEGGLDRADEMWATTEIVVNAPVTLTVEDYLPDEARGFVLIFTGAGGEPVTHPAVDKPYILVNNCIADITFEPESGTGATVRAGTAVMYYTNEDASLGYVIDPTLDKIKTAAAHVSLGGFKLTNVGTPTASSDAATKGWVDALAASSDLGTVAAIADEIVAVAGNEANINAVNANSTNINAVAANEPNIDTVAGIAASITTAAGIDGEIVTVAGISADVTTVAANAADVSTVADNIGTITTNAANIATVAGISSEVTTVAQNVASIDLVADNMTDVQNAGAIVGAFKTTAFAYALAFGGR